MKIKYNKVVRDRKVGVLYSPGYGAGWSTWNEPFAQAFMFDHRLVKIVEEGRNEEITEEFLHHLFGIPEDVHLSVGGVDQLEVRWVDQGRRFVIDEYDGSESIGPAKYFVA